MIAGPHEKIYVGGYPDYGLLGGAISVYDPEKNAMRVYRHVVQNQSIASFAYMKTLDLIAAGSSVRGGTGTHAVEKEAKLILWDPKEEKKIFEIIPVSEAKTILSLVTTEDGIVYGITENQKVFVFDSEKREIKKVFALEFKDPLEISLQIGPDGRIYGLAKDDQVSLLVKSSVPISSGMAVIGWKIYFGSGSNLYEFEIPKEPTKE
jgi:hypothetical protein